MLEPVLVAVLAAGAGAASPEEVAGWRAEAPAARYDPQTIFDYIDGHGEVYLAYGMRSCAARRYAGPPGELGILLDVFEMGSAADAYGVFTHSREGEPAAVGEDSSLGAGTLAFWKGTTFVSITAERPSERALSAVLALGRAIAASLPAGGARPGLVARLPRDRLVERSVVYLRHPQILAAHLSLGSENVLGVAADTPAVVARYVRDAATAHLVLVDYRSAPAAAKARASFANAFEKAGTPPREDGWWASALLPGPGHAVVFVIKASSKKVVEALLAEAAAQKGGSR